MGNETNNLTDPCPDPTCKVAYWADIVERNAWEGKAVSSADARMSLGSAELVCSVFHKTSKLCTCTFMAYVGTRRVNDSSGCLLHDPARAHEAARVRSKLIETTRRAGV